MKILTCLQFALLFYCAFARNTDAGSPSSAMESENSVKIKIPDMPAKMPKPNEEMPSSDAKSDGNAKNLTDHTQEDMNKNEAAKQEAMRIIDTIPKAIPPSADDILRLPLNVLFDFPSIRVSTAINNICFKMMAGDMMKPIYTPDVKNMQLQLRTACKKMIFPMESADEMFQNSEFDTNKNTVIFVSGWTTKENSSANDIEEMAKAYNCRGDTNFIALDAAQYVRTLYMWSALNTEEIGRHLSQAIAQLAEITPVEKIHLVGHSVGADIVGSAGRHFAQETGKTLPRITGLDPAKPCFNHGETLTGLMRGDAAFVDVIHSNVGVIGVSHSVGDVDFYPDGLAAIQKNCLGIVCSHMRSLQYFAETVYPGNEMNFMGRQCRSLTRMREGRCQNVEQPMGYAAPSNLSGSYMLEINGEQPFGTKAQKNSMMSTSDCGTCEAEMKKQAM